MRRDRLAHLKVDRPFLGLNDDIGGEFPIERMKDIVGGAGAVGLGVAPVQVVVVDKGAVEDDAAMGRERRGQQVGGVGWSAPVAGRAGLALGVGLDREAAEVRNQRVNLLRLGRPPGAHRRIQRVEARQSADLLRAGNVHAHRQPHAPRPQHISHPRQLLQLVGIQQMRVGIDIIDVDAVDTNRGQQTGILAHRRKILRGHCRPQKRSTGPRSRARSSRPGCPTRPPSGWAWRDGRPWDSQEVICRGRQSGNTEKGKRTIESTSLITANNDEQVVFAATVVAITAWSCVNPKTIWPKARRN